MVNYIQFDPEREKWTKLKMKPQTTQTDQPTRMHIYIYIYCDIHMSLPQDNMRFEVSKRSLLGFLVLTILAWNLFLTSGKIE